MEEQRLVTRKSLNQNEDMCLFLYSFWEPLFLKKAC